MVSLVILQEVRPAVCRIYKLIIITLITRIYIPIPALCMPVAKLRLVRRTCDGTTAVILSICRNSITSSEDFIAATCSSSVARFAGNFSPDSGSAFTQTSKILLQILHEITKTKTRKPSNINDLRTL